MNVNLRAVIYFTVSLGFFFILNNDDTHASTISIEEFSCKITLSPKIAIPGSPPAEFKLKLDYENEQMVFVVDDNEVNSPLIRSEEPEFVSTNMVTVFKTRTRVDTVVFDAIGLNADFLTTMVPYKLNVSTLTTRANYNCRPLLAQKAGADTFWRGEPAGEKFFLEVAVFKSIENAEALRSKAQSVLGSDVKVVKITEKSLNRVRVGSFTSLEIAKATANTIGHKLGLKSEILAGDIINN